MTTQTSRLCFWGPHGCQQVTVERPVLDMNKIKALVKLPTLELLQKNVDNIPGFTYGTNVTAQMLVDLEKINPLWNLNECVGATCFMNRLRNPHFRNILDVHVKVLLQEMRHQHAEFGYQMVAPGGLLFDLKALTSTSARISQLRMIGLNHMEDFLSFIRLHPHVDLRDDSIFTGTREEQPRLSYLRCKLTLLSTFLTVVRYYHPKVTELCILQCASHQYNTLPMLTVCIDILDDFAELGIRTFNNAVFTTRGRAFHVSVNFSGKIMYELLSVDRIRSIPVWTDNLEEDLKTLGKPLKDTFISKNRFAWKSLKYIAKISWRYKKFRWRSTLTKYAVLAAVCITSFTAYYLGGF